MQPELVFVFITHVLLYPHFSCWKTQLQKNALNVGIITNINFFEYMGSSKWQVDWTKTSFIFWLHTHNLWTYINRSPYALYSSLCVYQCNRCFLSLIMSTISFLPSITNFSSSNNLDMNRLCDKKDNIAS